MKTLRLVGLLLMSSSVAYAGQARTNQTETKAKTAQESVSAQGSGQSDAAKIDPAKRADILKLLEVTGTKARVVQIIVEMAKTIRPLMSSSLPAGEYREKLIDLFFVKFQSKFDSDRYLTDEDIKGMIQFYQTPLGQKTITVLPQLTQEAMLAGKKMGETLGKDSMMEVLEEHPELQKQMEDAANAAKP
jgi:uncharacterized protein